MNTVCDTCVMNWKMKLIGQREHINTLWVIYNTKLKHMCLYINHPLVILEQTKQQMKARTDKVGVLINRTEKSYDDKSQIWYLTLNKLLVNHVSQVNWKPFKKGYKRTNVLYIEILLFIYSFLLLLKRDKKGE